MDHAFYTPRTKHGCQTYTCSHLIAFVKHFQQRILATLKPQITAAIVVTQTQTQTQTHNSEQFNIFPRQPAQGQSNSLSSCLRDRRSSLLDSHSILGCATGPLLCRLHVWEVCLASSHALLHLVQNDIVLLQAGSFFFSLFLRAICF